jgi:hypothetical protein
LVQSSRVAYRSVFRDDGSSNAGTGLAALCSLFDRKFMHYKVAPEAS